MTREEFAARHRQMQADIRRLDISLVPYLRDFEARHGYVKPAAPPAGRARQGKSKEGGRTERQTLAGLKRHLIQQGLWDDDDERQRLEKGQASGATLPE